MSDPDDTLIPEEPDTDPDMVSIDILLAGLRDEIPVDWDGFASDALDE